ncbi:hypothetical protein BY458DRAFT_498055 [Sporodiniella umbellata]|nr:hypothetical protein BY458DRAFT_498055 [Sporodiniella umbellata]
MKIVDVVSDGNVFTEVFSDIVGIDVGILEGDKTFAQDMKIVDVVSDGNVFTEVFSDIVGIDVGILEGDKTFAQDVGTVCDFIDGQILEGVLENTCSVYMGIRDVDSISTFKDFEVFGHIVHLQTLESVFGYTTKIDLGVFGSDKITTLGKCSSINSQSQPGSSNQSKRDELHSSECVCKETVV